jgi:hypothetical protein
MQGYHDIGGEDFGSVDRGQHNVEPWEKRVDALLVLLSRKGVITVDELRLGIETLGSDAYDRLTYYERWIASITRALMSRGIISTDELGREMANAADDVRS